MQSGTTVLERNLAIPKNTINSLQSLSCVWLFATPWTATHQASLSITNSGSLFKFMSIKLVMPSDHVILCCPLFLLPSIFPNIRVFSNESVLCIRWPKYWSFSFSISPSNEYSGLTGLISLQFKGLPRVFSNTTVQKHQLFGTQLSLMDREAWHAAVHGAARVGHDWETELNSILYSPTLTSIHDYWKNHSFDETDLCRQSNVSAF